MSTILSAFEEEALLKSDSVEQKKLKRDFWDTFYNCAILCDKSYSVSKINSISGGFTATDVKMSVWRDMLGEAQYEPEFNDWLSGRKKLEKAVGKIGIEISKKVNCEHCLNHCYKLFGGDLFADFIKYLSMYRISMAEMSEYFYPAFIYAIIRADRALCVDVLIDQSKRQLIPDMGIHPPFKLLIRDLSGVETQTVNNVMASMIELLLSQKVLK